MKRKTHEEYVAELAVKNHSVTVVGDYVNTDTKITHRCSEGHEWDGQPHSILRGSGCPTCYSNTKERTHAEYVAEVNALDNKGITVVGEYVNKKTKITHRCAAGHEWDAQPSNILQGSGCPTCGGTKKKTHAEYVAEVESLKKGIKVVSDYVDIKTKITHRCSEGHEWDAQPLSILRGSGCPHCGQQGTDANVFYIWQNANDPGVYKVGITSERCADERIAICTRKNGMTANVILMASTPNARDIERRALELGDDPRYPDTIDGHTEFRRYSDAELGEVWRMAVGA